MSETRSQGEERDLLEEGKEAFELAQEFEADNREAAKDDLRFGRLGEQWPEEIRKQREAAQRPCLTTNMMNTFIRQVVNDARQNKPSIKVHPADDDADPQTAEIMNGLIRNIEYTSDADVAYDTATESAVSMGWGYFKIDYDYAYDNSTDLDIAIRRVANPFSIYGDPFSSAADSSDWNSAFEAEWMSKEAFERQFPNQDEVDWEFDFQGAESWRRDKEVMVAKWWRREEVERKMVVLSNGAAIDKAVFDEVGPLLVLNGITGVREHTGRTHKVKRHIMTGAKVVKSEDWLGKFIPIVPVYGSEVIDEEGKRHFRSLIRDGKDAQRNYNYWTTTATELVALTPRVPWIGPKGAFKSDARNWATANTENHAYLEYDGQQPPQRQPIDSGPAAGALQEALRAQEDMKATIGLFNASMGAQGNETSGKAILVRQREGDVSTFHFQDNMARAIRHAGRILIDLIPKIYNTERVVRIMGEDGTPENVPLLRPVPAKDENDQPQMQPRMGQDGQPIQGPDGRPFMEQVKRIYDLSIGKYDLTVTTGPSFTTKREEAAYQMTEMLRIWPQAAPLIGDLVAKNLDWPGADEIAKRLKPKDGDLPPEVQQMIEQGKQQIAQQAKAMEQMQAYILRLEADRSNASRKVDVDEFNAETKRLDTLVKMQDAGTSVPDALGPTGDYDGMIAAAEANKLNATADRERANAGLAQARAVRELAQHMQPQQQPQPVIDPNISQMPQGLRRPL